MGHFLGPWWDFLASCGVIGFAILGLGLLLFLVGAVLVTTAGSRAALVVFVVVSLVPLLLGVGGTALGYARVRAVAAQGAPPEAVAYGKEIARRTTYLGGGATAVLFALGLIGFAVCGGPEQSRKAP
jgi:hypothetical protein